MKTFGQKVYEYYQTITIPKGLPGGVEVLDPFSSPIVLGILKEFYTQFFDDHSPRTCLIGINPGRFGAGVTGIPFTDPIRLNEVLNIDNSFDQRQELSSLFIYKMIAALGGPKIFYENFYFTSVSPIGFIKNEKNLNYYDLPELEHGLESYILAELRKQIAFGVNPIAFSIGMGKNIAYLRAMNKKYSLFDDILPLPHPRWVMQYRLKRVDEFIDAYKQNLIPFITE